MALFIAKFKGVFSKESQQKSVPISNKFSENPSQDLAENGMFNFKGFLLFWVILAGGKTNRKEKDFSKKKIVSLVGFGFQPNKEIL